MAGTLLWADYSWVIRGRQKVKLLRLLDKPQTATELKKGTKLPLTNISRVLIQFTKRGLAECLTPEETRSRVYRLTERGEAVRQELLKRQQG